MGTDKNEQQPLILQFKRPEENGRKVYWKDRTAKGVCAHPRTYIDHKKRTLECVDCGAPVDPFDFLATLARHEDGIDARVQALREWENKINEERERRRLICKHSHLFSTGDGNAKCASCGTVVEGAGQDVPKGYNVRQYRKRKKRSGSVGVQIWKQDLKIAEHDSSVPSV